MKKAIETKQYKVYGQLEKQANEKDVDAFVFRNGEVVPAEQAERTTNPGIRTAPEKVFA